MSGRIGTPLSRNVRNEIRSKIHDGRTINHSLCDVIDNSIDADATKIDVWVDTQPDCDWIPQNEKGFLMIIDNGNGIEDGDLKHIIEFNAERKESYKPHELGSFGLGLKDALLAHGKEITVLSREEGKDFAMVRLSMELSYERDDWIYVNNDEMFALMASWENGEGDMIRWNTPALNKALETIESMEKGTIVILEFSHRQLEVELEEDSEDDLDRISVLGSLREWIAMTFSDYLMGINIGNRTSDSPLEINLNGTRIEHLDPFMKSAIGVGELDGQQGTLTASYEFDYSGLACVFNQFILPNKDERSRRFPGHDNRMKRATKHQVVNLQGIYIKRNGRILDGPWNGSWRREGMGMNSHHYTPARWELVLPSEAVNFPELVPPDKSRVSLLDMLSDILRANKTKRLWHPEDAFEYSTARTLGELQFNKRTRARGDSHDLFVICEHDECSTRVINKQFCSEHTVNRCQMCEEVLEIGSICASCSANICSKAGCQNIRINDSEYCIACSQPNCEIENCTNTQMVTGNYCAEHASQICNFPGGCDSLSQDNFSRCAEHMELDFHDTKIILSTEGPLLNATDDSIIINIDHEDFSRYLHFIQNVR
jgi:hypothetical protein